MLFCGRLSQQASRPSSRAACCNRPGAREFMRTTCRGVFVVCLCFAAAPARRAIRRETLVESRDRRELSRRNRRVSSGIPTPEIAITSEALGIIGSKIDFVTDLGHREEQFKQLQVVLRPGHEAQVPLRVHADHLHATATLKRTIIFNGIALSGLAAGRRPSLKWKAYRFGYEYDFVYTRPRLRRLGARSEVHRRRSDPCRTRSIRSSCTRSAPIPAIGAIGRGYVAPNISITGEFSVLTTAARHFRMLQGALLRLRSLRHGELHRLRRRAGGISLVRRLLPCRRRRGRSAAPGACTSAASSASDRPAPATGSPPTPPGTACRGSRGSRHRV